MYLYEFIHQGYRNSLNKWKICEDSGIHCVRSKSGHLPVFEVCWKWRKDRSVAYAYSSVLFQGLFLSMPEVFWKHWAKRQIQPVQKRFCCTSQFSVSWINGDIDWEYCQFQPKLPLRRCPSFPKTLQSCISDPCRLLLWCFRVPGIWLTILKSVHCWFSTCPSSRRAKGKIQFMNILWKWERSILGWI
jgi:hypothetical protein